MKLLVFLLMNPLDTYVKNNNTNINANCLQTLIPDLFEALRKKDKKIAVFGEMLNHEEGAQNQI